MISDQTNAIARLKAAGQAELANQLQLAWNNYRFSVLTAKPDGDLRDPLWRDAVIQENLGSYRSLAEFVVQPGVLSDGTTRHEFGQFATNKHMADARGATRELVKIGPNEWESRAPTCGVRLGQIEADLVEVIRAASGVVS